MTIRIRLLQILTFIVGCAPHVQAHMLNATRMTVYFAEGTGFAADLYVDLAQSGITYEEYHHLSRMDSDLRKNELTALHRSIFEGVAFHFDGWPVSVKVRETVLPQGDLDFFLDYYQPKMTRIRVAGERPPDSVVFSITTSADAPVEFPLMIRAEMPGAELPSSGVIGERGMSSLPFVLRLLSTDEPPGDDLLLARVVAMGEGISRGFTTWIPHQSETMLAVFALSLFALRRPRMELAASTGLIGVVTVAFLVMALLPVFAVAWLSPILANAALIFAAAAVLLRGPFMGPSAIGFGGILIGGGLWQMASPIERLDPGFGMGYGLAVLAVIAGTVLVARIPALVAPLHLRRSIRFGIPRILAFSVLIFAFVWLIRSAGFPLA